MVKAQIGFVRETPTSPSNQCRTRLWDLAQQIKKEKECFYYLFISQVSPFGLVFRVNQIEPMRGG